MINQKHSQLDVSVSTAMKAGDETVPDMKAKTRQDR